MIPENWNKVDEKEYNEVNKQTAPIICTDAFTKKSNGKDITVLFYEMGEFQKDTFTKMKEYIKSVNEENYLIDGDPNAPDFEDTSIVSYLYYNEFKMGKYNAFMTIARLLVGENKYNIACQINYEKDGKLCNAQYAMPEFDKNNVNESLQKDGTLAEIIEYLEVWIHKKNIHKQQLKRLKKTTGILWLAVFYMC